MPTRYNTVVSQTQPEEWVICWHNKHEIIFTQIHIIPHTKGGGGIEEKKQILENYVKNIVTSHETTCHFRAIAISRTLHIVPL